MLRRRIAPVAFVAAIALLARETCNKQERIHATLVLDFGAAMPDVRAVDAELWIDGEQLSVFHRAALDGMQIGVAKFAAALPAADAELRIEVQLSYSVPRVRATRHVHADDGATVTIPLERDLLGTRAP